MKKTFFIIITLMFFVLNASISFSAYHHEDEMDSDRFLAAYPEKTGTKLDHCALCHSGGQYINSKGAEVSLGSCQWCHYSYGYDGSGNIAYTLNLYGKDYYFNGRDTAAFENIKNFDSDGDGFSNDQEIQADRFPGNANDDPTQKTAPFRIYTKAELEAMPQHTQFMLMNTSRSGDSYAEYTGVPMEYLLEDAGILDSATGILVYAPDGWSNYHPLEDDPDPELYHVNGVYPEALFYYDSVSDTANGGWCDYTAPSCAGRNNNDPIFVSEGLKMILAIQREGQYMDSGELNEENKLDGEGPYRVVPPQKVPGPPDQSSKDSNPALIWPYNYDWDHNAGAASRTVTIIKVMPLPPGTTDIDVLEAGWDFVDEEKIIIYGAIFDPNAQEEEPYTPSPSYPIFYSPYIFPSYPGGFGLTYSGQLFRMATGGNLFGGNWGASPFSGFSSNNQSIGSYGGSLYTFPGQSIPVSLGISTFGRGFGSSSGVTGIGIPYFDQTFSGFNNSLTGSSFTFPFSGFGLGNYLRINPLIGYMN